jgi:hypothetical protein
MPKIITIAGKKLADQVDAVMRKYHPKLAEVKPHLTLLCISASRDKKGEPTGPALKLHGYPCLATIKINSPEDRVAGKGDVTIKFDADQWDEMPERTQVATIAHELEHLELCYDAEGHGPLVDDNGRPKFKMKLHDAQVGVFYEVMEQFGADAIDTQSVAKLYQESRQWVQPLLQLG